MVLPSRFSASPQAECWLALFLVVFTTTAIRLAEFPFWNDPAYFIQDERLMATHDAYAWLAGAKDIGGYSAHAFSRLLAFLHNISGMELSEIGFWSPVLLVPLLAIPTCLLAWTLGRPEAGLVFGILTTCGLGFLVRTRLGFCDTDLIALILPLATGCALAAWLTRIREIANHQISLTIGDAIFAAGIGTLGWISVYTYPSNISLMFSACILGAALAFFFIPAGRREGAATGMLLVFAMTFGGWAGTILATSWLIWRMRWPAVNSRLLFNGWLFIVASLLVLTDTHEKVWWIFERLFFYAKTSSPLLVNATEAIRLPEIAQSVREAQALEWGLLGPRMGGNWFVFSMGLIGFCVAAWRRPMLLLFLPYLILGIASVKLGNRFSMYGTVAIGMGIGFGLSELLHLLKQSQGRRWIAQLSMACVALWPSAQFMAEVRPVPVLPKVYAETFVELQELAEPDALLWQWWDYGYAAQYYAERATMGDGARQAGPWLYPLALVHCAKSSREAAQLMRYFGHITHQEGQKSSSDPLISLLAGNPVAELLTMDASQAKVFVDGLATAERLPDAGVSQYFTVSWENLRLAGWISYYGHWDMVAATSQPGKIQQVSGDIRIDSASGGLILQGQTVPLDSLDVIQSDGDRHFTWPNGTGMHVIINQYSSQVFLMDAKMYRSMMIQMLIKPATDFADEFELILDRSPWNRVYKVR